MARASAQVLKRITDWTVALIALVLLSPVLIAAIVAVIVETGKPVFFRQQRAGLGGRPFSIIKLRTMRVDVPRPEDVGQVRAGNELVTRAGRALRRLKIDEVTQLLNVLRGEMSLVGPRPTLMSQVAQYGPSERERLAMRPGMTGWAQVNGNTLLDWPDRISLDRWYVRHWTYWLDIKIMLMTLVVVIRGERLNRSALDVARKEGL